LDPHLLDLIKDGGPWGLVALFGAAIAVLWRERRADADKWSDIAKATQKSLADSSQTIAAFTVALESSSRSNEARLQAIQSLVANGEAQEKILSFLIEEVRSLRSDLRPAR
jgi:MYXO-CTERM domain-containing protein